MSFQKNKRGLCWAKSYWVVDFHTETPEAFMCHGMAEEVDYQLHSFFSIGLLFGVLPT